MSELSTANGEEVAARSTDCTASRNAWRLAMFVGKSEGSMSGCMSHMIRARLILVVDIA